MREVRPYGQQFASEAHHLIRQVAGEPDELFNFIHLVWSEQLLDEAKQTLVKRKGVAEDVAQRWVDYLPENFPAGRTNIPQGTSAATRRTR